MTHNDLQVALQLLEVDPKTPLRAVKASRALSFRIGGRIASRAGLRPANPNHVRLAAVLGVEVS